MSKLTETMAQHPEMTPEAITRIEVNKVAEPTLRNALLALVDLVEFTAGYALPTEPAPAEPSPNVEA